MSEFIDRLIPALGDALVDFTWQGVLIAALTALVLRVMKQSSPQVRYAIACIALLASVLVPLVNVWMAFADTAPIAFAFDAFARDTTVVTVSANDNAPAPQSLQPLIVALWAAGASVFCLRTLFGVAWVQRMRALPQPPLQAKWQATLDALALRFDLRGVSLRLVEKLESPVVAGCWRPVVLLPMSVALRMPSHLVEALLAHELAHVRRHDYLVNLLQRAAEALLFFHPVTWWLSRRIRIERELVADAIAAEAIGDARRLAVALATLSDLQSHRPALPHLAHAAHGGHLMSRIQQLVKPQSRHRVPAGRVALPLLGIAAACIAFYAQAQIGKPDEVVAVAPVAPVAEVAPVADAAPVAAPAAVAAPAKVAAPAAVAAPAVAAAPTQVQRHVFNEDDRDAWALVRKGKDGYSMSGSTDDMDEIETAKRSLTRDFIWFRRDGKAYVIDDPSIVNRAQAAWKDTDAMGERMSVLGAQMDVHGKKMEALGKQMEKLAKLHEPSPAMQKAQEEMEGLAGRQQELAGKSQLVAMKMRRSESDAEHAKFEKEMNALHAEMNQLGDQMEAQGKIMERESRQMERNTEPMERLGDQMSEASKPMEALGDQMGELGKQQERLAKKAQKDLDALISEGVRNGLAKPAPWSRTNAQ